MNQSPGNHIVIIGGGFCGTMTAVHLFAKAKRPLSITIFNNSYPDNKGIAFHTYSDSHVLNVPCQNMSAFPNEPDHFLNWCKTKNELEIPEQELAGKFLPRNLYGKYLAEIFKNSLQNKSDLINFELIRDEVIDIEKSGNQYIVHSKSGNKVHANKVVIATGNHPPSHPPLSNKSFVDSPRYFANPWHENAVSNIEPNETILIIGTGLTMVDVVLGLKEKQFKGKIIALSPNGFNILAHKKHHPQRNILDELEPPYDLTNLFRLFYKHVRDARLRGESGETVVDAVRLYTQVIWQQLSLEDKKRFMVHLRHLWGVARHRLPAEIHERIQEMISKNNMQVIAGRIHNIVETSNNLIVDFSLRGGSQKQTLTVQRIINCTGPQTDISKFQGRLYSNLLEKKIIHSDEMKLGIDATAEGYIIDHEGNKNKNILTLGSLLKGKLWESTAIPELRKQAELVAELLLKD